MTQEELRAQAKQDKCETIRGLHRLFKIPEGCSSTAIATIVDSIVSASVAEMLAELEERKG